jgi:hypothetical protein
MFPLLSGSLGGQCFVRGRMIICYYLIINQSICLFFAFLIVAGGPGGGVVTISSQTASIFGNITCDGVGVGGSGGGSGGSILIITDVWAGSGMLSANGGPSTNNTICFGGGGGGGRIAVHYTDSAYIFNGSITTYGGFGAYPGGPGTIYLRKYTANSVRSTLIVDNNKQATNTTSVISMATTVGGVAWLTELNETLDDFDEIKITNNAQLAVSPTGSRATTAPTVST